MTVCSDPKIGRGGGERASVLLGLETQFGWFEGAAAAGEGGGPSQEVRMTDEVPISHLQRRKIEGRVLMPFIEACRKRFGDGPTRDLVVATVRTLSAAEGSRWAEAFGGDIGGLRRIAEEVWA